MATHDFKVGDRVVIYSTTPGRKNASSGVIDRETKLYWIVGDMKFRKSDGLASGDYSWSQTPCLLPVDHELAVGAVRDATSRRLRNVVFTKTDALRKVKVDLADIEAVIAAAEAYRDFLKAQP